MASDGPQLFSDEEQALNEARSILERDILKMADEAGAVQPVLHSQLEIEAPEIEGTRYFVQAKITMTATGRPRLLGGI